MRVAVVAAFPFPYPQGSQVYVAEQTRALAEAGAEPVLLTYGRGEGSLPPGLDGIPWLRVAPSLSPGVFRSGPQWRKPLADAGLVARLVSGHRRFGFEVILAHNAEAALAALAARALTRVPVVYCAHTLMARELSAYAGPGWAGTLDRVGHWLDGAIAARADAVLALSQQGADALAKGARGPVRVIPPGAFTGPRPDEATRLRVCEHFGLRSDHFFLYSGNLDAYQDLELLAAAHRESPPLDRPIVVASHDLGGDPRPGGLRGVEVRDFAEMRALCAAASGLVLTRRRPGGFPIKLLNYMEVGRPIVGYAAVADGLEDQRSAWLLEEKAGPREIAAALRALAASPALRERLGAAGRQHLKTRHAWPRIAAETLALARAAAGRED